MCSGVPNSGSGEIERVGRRIKAIAIAPATKVDVATTNLFFMTQNQCEEHAITCNTGVTVLSGTSDAEWLVRMRPPGSQ
jgi:hypothetical protein